MFNKKGLKEDKDSKGKINKKDQLTLTDKDFIIKYDKLIMSRELKEADLDAHELNLEFSDEMMSKMVRLAVKQVIQAEVGLTFDEVIDLWNPDALYEFKRESFQRLATAVNNTIRPGVGLLAEGAPHPLDPDGTIKIGSLHHWTRTNNVRFPVNIIKLKK